MDEHIRLNRERERKKNRQHERKVLATREKERRENVKMSNSNLVSVQ